MLRFIDDPYYSLSKKEVDVLIKFGLKDPKELHVNKRYYRIKEYNRILSEAINDHIMCFPPKNSILEREFLEFITKRKLLSTFLYQINEVCTINSNINSEESIPTSRKNYAKLKKNFKKINVPIKYETEPEYLSNRDPFSDVIKNGSVQDMLERISYLNLVEFDEIEKEIRFIY